MRFHKLISISLIASGSMLSLLAQTSTTGTRTINLPPAGLGSTETARINVVNVASESSSGTAASCTGTISFLNASGTAIGSPATFTVTSGQISSGSLPFSSAGISGVRGEIRGEIQLTLTSGVPCALAFSFETFDSTTGATHIFLANPGGGPGPGFGGGGPGPGPQGFGQ
ncbi:MAG TPA: hypothetical protein VKG79_10765 [Bryobacteraceae bacterium]|nr:hypothetical protein [Bryobacteraceae bacterium]